MRQYPEKGTPFAKHGTQEYWIQTTLELHPDGTIPFSELPGVHPRMYTFARYWDIPKSDTGTPLRGKALGLGVAQYVVGELGLQKKVGSDKTMVENEPSWLNMEALRRPEYF